MVETIKKEWKTKVAIIIFIVLTCWWIILLISGVKETFQNYLFGASYGLMAVWGGIWGLFNAKEWGFLKSIMGRAVFVLSLGLLFEEFGQLVFSYYNLFANVTVPYPSLADIGFFGIIPLYSYGAFLLAKASGIKVSLKSFESKIQAFLIPLVMLSVGYLLFLSDYIVDLSDPLKTFLDFAYPLGDAIYISITILAYSLSRKLLGGIMRPKILFLLFAFVLQFAADFNFLFQSSRGTWLNAGYGDYLYLVAYFAMTLGLLQLNTILIKLKT